MIGRPPSSPLFPSTTLSRSEGLAVEHHAFLFERVRVRDNAGAGPHAHQHGPALAAVPQLADAHAGAEVVPAGVVLDRKSTRLNSSHLVISYAVFCLKKKTQ